MNTIGGCDLHELAARFGTPLYLYDAAHIERNCHALRDAFSRHYPATDIFYAVKANGNPHLLRLIAACGLGADCASPLEVTLAERAGLPRARVMYTGNYESREDLAAAARCGAVNLDDITALEKLPAGFDGILSFRVNPGEGGGSHPGIVTGGPDAKFGIPLEQAPAAYRLATERGFTRFGLHLMAGSNNRDPLFFARMTAILCHTAADIFRPLGTLPEYIDIGGGFGIPYADDETPLDLDATARAIATVLASCSAQHGTVPPRLRIEPGRIIVGDAGYLLASVTAVKEGIHRFVGLDAGMNTLLRPALYGARHRTTVVGKDTVAGTATLCGRICENTDIFATDIPFPAVAEGDLVLFHDAGAYCAAMAFAYNGRLLPAEVLCANGTAQIVARAESESGFLRRFEV